MGIRNYGERLDDRTSIFLKYIAIIFNEWLNASKIQRPVVMFLEGHRSHVTFHLSHFCRENGIILVALCPNATYILQFLDVAVFRSLKLHWKSHLRKWRYENDAEVNKNNIALALDKLLRNQSVKESIISGFRKCGLYPFDVNAVEFNKCRSKSVAVERVKEDKEQRKMSYLEYLESKIEPKIFTEFQQANTKCTEFQGDITAGILFNVWKAFKNDNSEEKSICSTNANQSVNAVLPAPSISDHVINVRGDPSMAHIVTEKTPAAVSTSDAPQLHIPTTSSVTSVSTSPFGCTIPKPKAAKSLDEVFNTVLKYPQKRAKKGSKIVLKKYYVPNVVTSDRWIQYYEQKEKKNKIDTELEKETKRQKKVEAMQLKKELKLKAVKKQRMKKKMRENDTSNTKDSATELVESASGGISKLTSGIGDYVIIHYENSYFHCVVVTEKNGSYQVRAMVKGGPIRWKWPKKFDLLWYSADDIIQIIPPITVTNSRGVYDVPELLKYKNQNNKTFPQ